MPWAILARLRFRTFIEFWEVSYKIFCDFRYNQSVLTPATTEVTFSWGTCSSENRLKHYTTQISVDKMPLFLSQNAAHLCLQLNQSLDNVLKLLELFLGASCLGDFKDVEPHSFAEGSALSNCDVVTHSHIPGKEQEVSLRMIYSTHSTWFSFQLTASVMP